MATDYFLRSTNVDTDCDNADVEVDLDQTIGSDGTVTFSTVKSPFVRVGAFADNVSGDSPVTGDHDVYVDIDSISANTSIRWRVASLNSGCGFDAVSANSNTYTTAGNKSDLGISLTWAGTGVHLKLGIFMQRDADHDTKTVTINCSTNDSRIDAPWGAVVQPVIPIRTVRDFGDVTPTINAFPRFLPFVSFNPPPPPVPSPVPPVQVVPFHFRSPIPEESYPKFYPFIAPAPLAPPANPVIPILTVPMRREQIPDLDGAMPKYTDFPWFTTFARPVIPFRATPMYRHEVPSAEESYPKFIYYPHFTTFARPIIPLRTTPMYRHGPEPIDSPPKYIKFPFFTTFARPVIPFRTVPMRRETIPDLNASLPKYTYFPWFTTFARPVIPYRTVPMFRHGIEPIDSPPQYVKFPFSSEAPSVARPVIPPLLAKFPFVTPDLGGGIPQFLPGVIRRTAAVGRNVIDLRSVMYPFTKPEPVPEPEYIHFPFFTTFARPIIPYRVGQWIGDRVAELDEAKPQYTYYPFFTTFARPVIPFRHGQWLGDRSPQLDGAIPQYVYYPFFTTFARPVIPIFKGQWLADKAPDLDGAIPQYIYYPSFTTFARLVLPFRVVPFHFMAPELDGAIPEFYPYLPPSPLAAGGVPVPPIYILTNLIDETDRGIANHPYMKPRFMPKVMFFTNWQDYESFLQYDDTKYGGSQSVFFEAILTDTATGPVRARLFNITDSEPIPSSIVQTTSSTAVRLRSGNLAAVISGAKEYKAQIGLKSGQTGDMGAGRLIVEQ